MNDFDDERTMEEEEALESQEDEAKELDALQDEQDMPLEELMKLYGYGGGSQPSPPMSTDIRKEKGKKKKKKHKEQAKSQKRERDTSENEGPSEDKLTEDDKIGHEVS